MMPLPRILERPSKGEMRFLLELEVGHEAFRGHFPGYPILPGVIQVDWAIRLGAEAFGHLGEFLGLSDLKFVAPILPGERIELLLQREAGGLSFRYRSREDRNSSGRILFRTR